ncbi:hypothetical protein [Bradyrhizobium sp.]|uniref:hypothetical protein n=1 Tax=Bradyrhizobium sp. TaxID=376 RepID=UPI00239B7548|nr:hypothetical protein [Bradyrhizobium sp.]MDE2376241.1 hypothetical protein [Bradyrhizobium sp.]
MSLFGQQKPPPPDDVLDVAAGPDALLQGLDRAATRYLEKTDRGELVYPACTRAPDAAGGGARAIWRDTRLEALRYLALIPGRESALLVSPSRQAEMIEGFLRLKPHDDIVIDFTGRAADDVAIAIVAGLNWLNHCAGLAKVDRARVTGILRNFRRVVVVAERWWATEGAAARCAEMLAAHEYPPLMLHLVWFEYTQLAKEIASAVAFPSEAVRAGDAWSRFRVARDPEELTT